MIAIEDTALILLAAGRSKRFHDGDKLSELFLGKPLAYHVTTALEDLPFLARIAVVWHTELDFESLGYHVVSNPEPERGMARSLCFGVAEARRLGAKAVLIALADMPRVTGAHIHRLFEALRTPGDIVASSDGSRPLPPALFGEAHFDALMALEGDQGARKLIAGGHHVVATPAELVDIDTQEDLEELRELYGIARDRTPIIDAQPPA
jgi:molybdenum cofactor cytidylyltransferase